MAIEIRDGALIRHRAFAGVVETLHVFGRVHDRVDYVSNGRAALELADPDTATRVGLTLEHMSIELVHNVTSITRARLLSQGATRENDEHNDGEKSSGHKPPLDPSSCK